MSEFILNRRNLLRGASTVGTMAVDASILQTAQGQEAECSERVDEEPEDGEVLIIKDCEPWNIRAVEIALSELDIPYEITEMECAVKEFPGASAVGEYQAVVLPSSQPTQYYISMGELRPRLDGFVEAGGALLAHMGNRGQPCSSITDMPLEVESDFSRYEVWQSSGGGESEELQKISIQAPDHPITQRFSDADLSEWSSAFTSFGEITGLPADATVLATLAADDDAATFVEYPKGDGVVLATMQIMEWPYGDGEQFDGTEFFLQTVLKYAVDGLPDAPSAEIAVDRTQTTVQSPVTLQVTDPVSSDYTYQWEVVSAPTDDPPALLDKKVEALLDEKDEKVDASRPERSTVLTPKKAETYRISVTVEDGDEIVGRGFTTIEVDSDDFDEWDVPEEFASEENKKKNKVTPSFDLEQFDVASSAAELAETYAPTINFHSEEQFYPTRYEAYFENANIDINGRDRTIAERVTAIDIGNENLHSDYDPSDKDNHLYLRGTESEFKRYQSRYPRAVYASVTGTTVPGDTSPLAPEKDTSYIALTYWFFYLFDPKSEDGLANNAKRYLSKHTSDTESFTILFDESGPRWVGAAQHYSGDFMRWEKAVSGGNRLEVYSAHGAHSTFLVNTDEYSGGVPGQYRYGPDKYTDWGTEVADQEIELDVSDTARPIGALGYMIADKTDDYESWAYEGTGRTHEYELLILSEESGAAVFNGNFVSDEVGEDEGGTLPQVRDERWSDPGFWIRDRMLRETEVVSARGTRVREAVPGVSAFALNTTGSAEIEGRIFNNGVKPHLFVVEATIEKSDTGEVVAEKTRTKQLPADKVGRRLDGRLEIRTRKDVTIPLDDIEPADEEYDIDIDFRTYPSQVGGEEDRLNRWQFENKKLEPDASAITIRGAPRIEPIGAVTGHGSAQGYASVSENGTVAPGESISRDVTVRNTGSETQTFLIEVHAEGPGDVTFGDEEATSAVTLDPDETGTVELMMSVPLSVPEGSYDLLTTVWLEDNAEDRFTKLNQSTEEEAFEIEKPVHELNVESTPEGAAVFIGGESLGQTPVTVDLRAGRYEIAVSKEDYDPVFDRFVHEDGETTLTYNLEQADESDSGNRNDNTASDSGGGGPNETLADVPIEAIVAGGATTAGLAYLAAHHLSDD